MNFDIDEIHQVRENIAERWSKMTKEEARADSQKRVNEVIRLGREGLKKRAMNIRRFALA
ncbi:hypothetical protein FACS1894139_18140 [Planctomycetales bacterium]|jgi:hypothetical protein|nr:hypothetical protein [Planctomycetota bacterium]GHT01700.1 hypothetical protein FACS1894108_15630 [Planctomycetales bacterium]GHT08449.1 hypothetical protein FACS1894139_18140 [Planctomycetales bacterium]GHV23723.1 hypothetical protein AGMMS49959_17720 [Planctomycetales bacterium]